MIKFLIFFLIINLFQLPTTNTARGLARKALRQDKDGLLDDAEVNYKRALIKQPTLYQARFNLANTLYRQERFAEALNQYHRLSNPPEIPIMLKARTFYNMGTIYLKIGRLPESKFALKKALKLNPFDNAARYNLAYVIKLLSEKNQGNHPKEKGTAGKTSGNPEEELTKSSEARNEESTKLNQAQQEQQNQQQENIEQMLKALDANERSIHDKMKRKYSTMSKAKVIKDW
ncbi:hypothetical protein AAE02nite_18230 [Adhaeribacter aerolatus]|uniref:Uncharacterized protein n=1 Tax=Adhaeribacter aerolatus TaxID=670289 RepID=A0A512AWR0_9BACT|nr:tetratricopeptide repeat protein [Adhaeribacter aerolatus]GEO04159.1 hypothetical protein AAE02nite_18230 [Adhaeribacter aerolatus]